ncbi:hypothetical protein ACS0TY_017743 [Phlomoides rotata]
MKMSFLVFQTGKSRSVRDFDDSATRVLGNYEVVEAEKEKRRQGVDFAKAKFERRNKGKGKATNVEAVGGAESRLEATSDFFLSKELLSEYLEVKTEFCIEYYVIKKYGDEECTAIFWNWMIDNYSQLWEAIVAEAGDQYDVQGPDPIYWDTPLKANKSIDWEYVYNVIATLAQGGSIEGVEEIDDLTNRVLQYYRLLGVPRS